MAIHFSKTKLAAAVSVAALGAGLAAPAGAVVVVGGNDGWEVSFDGNVNAFYTVGDFDAGYVNEPAAIDSSRVHSGYLPAFFSFNVKSPTVNGVTGTARISFAPTIHTSGAKTQFGAQGNSTGVDGISGATIDTREVVANLTGAFGEVSFGRTLSLFGRQAILNDMTLFGVGFVPGGEQFGSITFGRAGHGYTYPDFAARFQYTTPNISGFQAAIGMYDPSTISPTGTGVSTSIRTGLLDETDQPRFEGELSYSTSFSGGSAKVWADGMWQTLDSSCTGRVLDAATGVTVNCNSISPSAWGIGGKMGMAGFEVVGYYHEDEGVGLTTQFNSLALEVDQNGNIAGRDGDGYYVQGTYTFSGKTKVGVSYGEGNLDSAGTTAQVGGGTLERTLWTVGVYHDVSSWLRLVAEYNHGELKSTLASGASNPSADADTVSVGGFLFW
jgi:hypothetical protein